MVQIDEIYSRFEKELIDEAKQEVDDILLPLRRLNLGLPQSQQHVVNFTSGKYVCVSVCLSVCICVCICVVCVCVCMHVSVYTYYSTIQGWLLYWKCCVELNKYGVYLWKLLTCLCLYLVCFYFSIRYTGGLKEIVYGHSLIFSVIVLFLLLCICFAMVWGSYNIYYIYLCGNDPLFVQRAHQAGIMLKKWVLVLGWMSMQSCRYFHIGVFVYLLIL